MIRSGSTLQYNLVRNLVEASGSGRGEGFVSDPNRDDRLKRWSWNSTLHVAKMHEIADWMLEEQARKTIRFFFSHRDLRDVAASAKRKFGWSGAQIWQAIDTAIGLQQHLQDLPEAQIQRYAQLAADPSTTLATIAECLGLPLSNPTRARIISACSLSSAQKVQAAIRDIMSARGVSTSPDNKASIFDQTTLLHHNHISSSNGEDGAWQHDLTTEDLHTLNARYQQWQQIEGYVQSWTQTNPKKRIRV
jgi:hypothetical protein